MTKLITETPEQPIPFLIDHLQSKQGSRGQLQRTLSGSAALWAESESPGMFWVLERARRHVTRPHAFVGDLLMRGYLPAARVVLRGFGHTH